MWCKSVETPEGSTPETRSGGLVRFQLGDGFLSHKLFITECKGPSIPSQTARPLLRGDDFAPLVF